MAPAPHLDSTTDEQVASTRARLPAAPPRRESIAELNLLVLMLALCGALALLEPPDGFDVVTFGVLVIVYAVAHSVEFEVAGGYTAPTLPPLAAMLVLLPPGVVPLAVALAVTLSTAAKVVKHKRHPARIALAAAGALPVVAPAAVVAALGAEPSWGSAPEMLLALAAYIAADALVAVAMGRATFGAPARGTLHGAGWVYLVDVLLAPAGFAIAVAARDHLWVVPAAVIPLAALLRVFADERRERIGQALQLSQAYRGTAMLLGDVVEADDAYTGSHSRAVVGLAVELGRRMRLREDQLRRLEFAALLHDVGKIAVPNEIINKPGPLDDDEWAIMKRHTIEGQRMLEGVGGVLAEVGVIVRASHEGYDGRGYPDGLAGEEIPVEARICAACDAFSAMTTDRSYRRALSFEAAVAELHRCSGTQFDPQVVDHLVQIL